MDHRQTLCVEPGHCAALVEHATMATCVVKTQRRVRFLRQATCRFVPRAMGILAFAFLTNGVSCSIVFNNSGRFVRKLRTKEQFSPTFVAKSHTLWKNFRKRLFKNFFRPHAHASARTQNIKIFIICQLKLKMCLVEHNMELQ